MVEPLPMVVDTRHWWSLAIRGAVAIVLGILLLVHPWASLAGLVFAFGLWALLDGISAFISVVSRRGGWELVFEGIAGIAIGVITFVVPALTALALYAAVTIWVLATGVLRVAMAIRLRHVMHHELWLALSGIISLLFGVLLLATPGLGTLVLATWIGVYALFFGFLMIAFSLRLRQFGTTRV